MRRLIPSLVLTALPLAPASAQPGPPPAIAGTRLDINAIGEVQRTPDLATIAALKRAGIADRDIQTASLTLSPQYRYGDNQPPVLTGYQASNRVSVRLRDLARAGGVVDALVAAGANQIDGPSLSIDRPQAALDEARTSALAIARSRAELYARAAGLHVKRIVSIAESGEGAPPPVVPMMMKMARAQAETPISAGESSLSVALQVTFELD